MIGEADGTTTTSRDFKLEAFRLVREQRVSVAQADRSLDTGGNVLRRLDRRLLVKASLSHSSSSNFRLLALDWSS